MLDDNNNDPPDGTLEEVINRGVKPKMAVISLSENMVTWEWVILAQDGEQLASGLAPGWKGAVDAAAASFDGFMVNAQVVADVNGLPNPTTPPHLAKRGNKHQGLRGIADNPPDTPPWLN